MLKHAAQQIGMPFSVVAAQVQLESDFDPSATSSAGAEGEFQFLPSTYTGLGFPAGTEYDASEEVKAYIAYMSDLLRWSGGSVQKALAAYNAGQGNWQAGLGYANTILANAGQGVNLTGHPGPGVGGGSGGGSGGGQSLNVSQVIKEMGTLLHDTAHMLNFAFELFAPGQGFRIAAGAGAGLSAYGAVHTYARAPDDSLPLVVALSGISALAAYMALRPWPVSAGKPIRPAAYVADIFGGHPPASQPLPDHTGEIEVGLTAVASIWTISKVAQAASNASGILGVLGAIGGKLWGWLKGLGKGGEGEGDIPIGDVVYVEQTGNPPPGVQTTAIKSGGRK